MMVEGTRIGMLRQRPTLEQVAARAGVSRATVSRVVNGSTTVASEIRKNVLRAVQELGYVPNHAARSLVTQRTNSVALVLPEPSTLIFSDDQFFPAIIRGVSQEMEAADKQLVLMMANSTASHDRIEQYAMAGHVDGVMMASVHGADPLPTTLARMGVPVVCNGRPLGRSPVPYVDVDSFAGAVAAVRRFIEAGRQRIATIAGPQDMVAGIDRLAGYRAELRNSKRRSIVAVGDFTRESGAVAMRQLLDDDPALDAMIGFDDIELARYTEPQLTTVRQPIVELGRELARQLLRLAGGEEIEPALVLPTSLVVRESGWR